MVGSIDGSSDLGNNCLLICGERYRQTVKNKEVKLYMGELFEKLSLTPIPPPPKQNSIVCVGCSLRRVVKPLF